MNPSIFLIVLSLEAMDLASAQLCPSGETCGNALLQKKGTNNVRSAEEEEEATDQEPTEARATIGENCRDETYTLKSGKPIGAEYTCGMRLQCVGYEYGAKYGNCESTATATLGRNCRDKTYKEQTGNPLGAQHTCVMGLRCVGYEYGRAFGKCEYGTPAPPASTPATPASTPAPPAPAPVSTPAPPSTRSYFKHEKMNCQTKTGASAKVGVPSTGQTPESCQAKCDEQPGCTAFMFGKNHRQGECYLKKDVIPPKCSTTEKFTKHWDMYFLKMGGS